MKGFYACIDRLYLPDDAIIARLSLKHAYGRQWSAECLARKDFYVMSCNAWNHPPGCDCGWGGRGQSTRGYAPSSDYYMFKPNIFRWQYHDEDFCHPTYCPLCGDEVFFVRHNGGSVWFDALGKPWPKHACFDTARTPSRFYYHSAAYGWNSTYGVHKRLLRYASEYAVDLFGVVIEGEVRTHTAESVDRFRRRERPKQLQNSLVIRMANGKKYIVYVSAELNFKPLIGEFVLLSTRPGRLIFVSLDQIVPFLPAPLINETIYVHETFGHGTLRSVRKAGDDYRIVVDFEEAGVKHLMASYSNLRRV